MPDYSFSIHAHFYQPPREDPLTGFIPAEAGASPYSNWNQRIHAECYRPNAGLGNFGRISFNIGPTLFSWMEGHDAATCRNIVAQDRANFQAHGVGNALAQAYNHTILPLASYQDKVTQVTWGIADFEHRFGHKPQGMWLPETAADLETLSVLADSGIEFTILAPWQAHEPGARANQPYRVELPGGRAITVLFYNAELSGGVSFNPGLTFNADWFAAHQLKPGFMSDSSGDDEPQLLLIATDGELYGHHQKLREYFLAHLVNGASKAAGLAATYPGLWLRAHPPQSAIRLREQTSWSCHHGVRRWVGTCDCTPGDSRWKTRLRSAFDRLAAEIDRIYIEFALPYIPDPWLLRNHYIHVMLGRVTAAELIDEAALRHLPDEIQLKIHLLLEAQRARQRMYTSCGWFFDDFDRIEPQNNLASAAQAVRLVRRATGVDLEAVPLGDLHEVTSQRTGLQGDAVFLYHLRRAAAQGGG
jgi:alpha-amylase/alpha-mannosidase (GH57 family)